MKFKFLAQENNRSLITKDSSSQLIDYKSDLLPIATHHPSYDSNIKYFNVHRSWFRFYTIKNLGRCHYHLIRLNFNSKYINLHTQFNPISNISCNNWTAAFKIVSSSIRINADYKILPRIMWNKANLEYDHLLSIELLPLTCILNRLKQ